MTAVVASPVKNLIRRWADRLILLLDSDQTGRDRAEALAIEFREHSHPISVAIAHVPAKDPADLLKTYSLSRTVKELERSLLHLL